MVINPTSNYIVGLLEIEEIGVIGDDKGDDKRDL